MSRLSERRHRKSHFARSLSKIKKEIRCQIVKKLFKCERTLTPASLIIDTFECQEEQQQVIIQTYIWNEVLRRILDDFSFPTHTLLTITRRENQERICLLFYLFNQLNNVVSISSLVLYFFFLNHLANVLEQITSQWSSNPIETVDSYELFELYQLQFS